MTLIQHQIFVSINYTIESEASQDLVQEVSLGVDFHVRYLIDDFIDRQLWSCKR